jgi:CheY-like chemotaxis protein
MRILVVDDSSARRAFLQEFLVSLGHYTWTVDHGPPALLGVERGAPDAILLMQTTSGLGGFELLSHARSRGFRGPAILLCVDREPLQISPGWGPLALFAYPIRLSDLVGALQRLAPPAPV